MARRLLRPFGGMAKRVLMEHQRVVMLNSCRNYMSEMRREAFEGNILRLLRNEIRYELDTSPPSQPITEFNSFTIDERPGEQWIKFHKKFGENEEIKVEVTMFDASVPVKKGSDVSVVNDVQLHMTMIVNVFKGEGDGVLEFVCSVWPDSIEICKVHKRQQTGTMDQTYTGPAFKELDDELQDSLYEFLETRGINNELCVFLHQYMKNKDKLEYIRWIEKAKSLIEKKK